MTRHGTQSKSALRVPRRGTLSCFILLLIGCLCFLQTPCIGEEVELSSDWTLLGENDTLPAGAHIRMDLSTGEKWAKLSNDDDDDQQEKALPGTAKVEVDASGGVMAIVENEDAPDAGGPDQDYDYDMMHRTLLKLPPDEQERMGGLPEKPLDPETRKVFEERMKEIWTKRQAELESVQEEFLADMPKLLLRRIRSIEAYLKDPHSHLMEEWSNDEEGVSHIVSVLQDLEYHLSDVDMTRDLHTLGGWPLLVSLLSDNVHQSVNQTTTTPESIQKIHDIQANAAWAIGTATKNIGEFASYAMETVVLNGVATTPIELLLSQMNSDQKGDAEAVYRKQIKVLYALGSLLRGNRPAQVHFLSANGPAILGRVLADNSVPMDAKFAKRVLSLADDIVSDIVLHPSEDKKVDKKIIDAFSTKEWCKAVAATLEQEDGGLQETALRTVRTISPYCKWNKKAVRKTVQKIKSQWTSKKQEMDEDHYEEQLELVEVVLKQI